MSPVCAEEAEKGIGVTKSEFPEGLGFATLQESDLRLVRTVVGKASLWPSVFRDPLDSVSPQVYVSAGLVSPPPPRGQNGGPVAQEQ